MEMIEDIEFSIEENKTLKNALSNTTAKHALLMCLLQIGETLSKIENEILKEKLPVKGSYAVRNFIAHDYEGVDMDLIENILRYLIPELKVTVSTLV